ncbi:HAD family hydrolase [Natronoglomus mannanivorans]|uniref:HAD family hydrolase n=1 Tax=Natronoglomus mannanivorans TaxID=2979990 RepID=A0AAP3E2G7_9EURY|nr:HAD family hydrolase [Halobacteria archaeon AArc-xg1-1]
MAAYDAICFDLDSTLCESTQDPSALLESTCDRVGVEPFCTTDDLRTAVPALPTAQTDREFYELLFAEVVSRVDREFAADVPQALANAYLEATDPSAVRFRPGAKAALELARDRGPVGLITNGGRPTQTQKLEALGIVDAFDVAVFTDPEAGIQPKPDTIPFERALSALEVSPGDAIHVGDSIHADVAGANAMGMDSAWIDLGHETSLPHEPTYELTSLEEFEGVVST